MESCKYCRWYKKEFDDNQAAMNDVITGNNEERHYCPMFMYPEHIPPKVFDDKANCKQYMK